jgi:hypothetical protein
MGRKSLIFESYSASLTPLMIDPNPNSGYVSGIQPDPDPQPWYLVIEIQTCRTWDRSLQVTSMVEKALQYLLTTISF